MNEVRPIDANVVSEMLQGRAIEMESSVFYYSLMAIPEDDVKQAIDITPTLDYAPVIHAHWIECESGELSCSACGIVQEDNPMKYPHCPMCGATMDGGV